MTTEEAVAKVTAQGSQLDKILAEVINIKTELAAALANGEDVPKALSDAIDAAGTKLQAVDDLNADQPAL